MGEDAGHCIARVRGRIEAVLGWATVNRYRSGDNPARWNGLLEHALPKLSKVTKVEHHSAMKYDVVPEFLARVRQEGSVAARALEFITLKCRAIRRGVGCQPGMRSILMRGSGRFLGPV